MPCSDSWGAIAIVVIKGPSAYIGDIHGNIYITPSTGSLTIDYFGIKNEGLYHCTWDNHASRPMQLKQYGLYAAYFLSSLKFW